MENGPSWFQACRFWCCGAPRRVISHGHESRPCSPRPEVRLYSITTLPRWVDSASAESDAQAAWGRYSAGLRIHEDNHRRIALKHASDLHLRLSELGTSECRELGPEVTKVAEAHFRRAQLEQDAYDVRTRHGATEGATFHVMPPPQWPPTDTISNKVP